jgi:hypothetical protein
MALNKLKFNSINVTAAANEALKFNSSANGFETGSAGGAMTFIKKLTASSSSTLSFVDGSSNVVLDNTYKEYIFKFINIHPETDEKEFQVNFSADGGSNYNVTKTTTFFQAYLGEAGDGSGETLDYASSKDLAQSTAYQPITRDLGNGNDECCVGILHLFNPSSTTFVKHFICVTNSYIFHNYSWNAYIAGYCNTTSAIDAVQFKMSSGNIDSGDIVLYGIN